MNERGLLQLVGLQVRHVRGERGWSRRELARRTGLSERFLAQVEIGRGNPSVLSLARIAAALGTTAAALLTSAPSASVIALLGLRGAGKSTVGRALAERLAVPFVELDARIEEAAGLSLGEIFELHGEDYYRRWERQALDAVLAAGSGAARRAVRGTELATRSDPVSTEGTAPGTGSGITPVSGGKSAIATRAGAVLATGGGIVTHRENFELLNRGATTIWLRAKPEEHWDRVVAQGDHRPMANDPLAKTHLHELLASREELYRAADHIVETSGAAVDEIVDRIVRLLKTSRTRR